MERIGRGKRSPPSCGSPSMPVSSPPQPHTMPHPLDTPIMLALSTGVSDLWMSNQNLVQTLSTSLRNGPIAKSFHSVAG